MKTLSVIALNDSKLELGMPKVKIFLMYCHLGPRMFTPFTLRSLFVEIIEYFYFPVKYNGKY